MSLCRCFKSGSLSQSTSRPAFLSLQTAGAASIRKSNQSRSTLPPSVSSFRSFHSSPLPQRTSPSTPFSTPSRSKAASRSFISKLLGGSGNNAGGNGSSSSGSSGSKNSAAQEAEEQRVRDRNMEMAKALERTLRGRSMAGLSSGMDVRCTTLDKSGQVATAAAHLSKSELCAKYGIQPRDLRKLDSAVPTVVPTILARKSCIILTMLHLRLVITAKEMTIFDSVGSEDSWLKGVFLWSAEHALKSSGSSTAMGVLPYEFKALEAALTSVVAALENDLANIRSHVVELLNVMENHIDRDNLRLMLQYSRKLSIFQKRAALVQEALDELLSTDDDLAAMYLTAKIQGKPRLADDHEEIELLLESFSKQCEEIVSEVETLSANVRHTEDIIELILDANRNSLLGLDLRVSIATLGLTAGAMVAALFGMNLTSHLEDSPYSFTTVTLLAFALSGAVTGFGLRRLRTLRKVNLGWREELRAAGDRWAARKRSRRRD